MHAQTYPPVLCRSESWNLTTACAALRDLAIFGNILSQSARSRGTGFACSASDSSEHANPHATARLASSRSKLPEGAVRMYWPHSLQIKVCRAVCTIHPDRAAATVGTED